jgi:aminopeptidase N
MRRACLWQVLAIVGAALVWSAVPAVAVAGSPACAGAPGAGDPYYPGYGNGGYNVRHYGLDLTYDPVTDRLEGRASIRAKAKQDLCSFNLDLVGFELAGVRVDGKSAAWSRTGQELTVTPRRSLENRAGFRVAVRYGGVPAEYLGSYVPVPIGFTPTSDGANAIGQPESAASWFPVNDHPRDKASYSFEITVPDGYEVVANGKFHGVEPAPGGMSAWRWEAREPMASYLATIGIGHWDVARWRTEAGVPVYDAVDPQITGALRAAVDSSLARQGEILDLLSGRFGPYPFNTVGAIVDPEQPLGYALETQTRPAYWSAFWLDFDTGAAINADFVVVHELAHQWFGDAVALERWRDIWLNEGLATYAEWLWLEHEGEATPRQVFEGAYSAYPADDPIWSVVIGDPGPDLLLDNAVYVRGAMTVQALREEIGDKDFWKLIRRWAKRKSGGHGTTAQFIGLAERVSGLQLDDLFNVWLYSPGRPELPAAKGRQRAGSPGSAPARAWFEATEERLRHGGY